MNDDKQEPNIQENDNFEEYGIDEAVPMTDRHYSFTDMMSTWIVANANPTSWYVGSTLGAMGMMGAIGVAFGGNIITYIILSLVGLMGYRMGIANMGLARVPFGIRGSKVPSLFNALQFVGWTGVNTFIAAIPLSGLLHSAFGMSPYGSENAGLTLFVSILIIMIPTVLISVVGGSQVIKIAQNISTVLLTVLSIWIFVRIFQNYQWADIVAWEPPSNIKMPFGVGIDALAALGFAWIMAVADYTRYTETKVAATVAPMLGATFGMVWFSLLGSISAIAVAITTNNFDPALADPGTITTMLGMGSVASILIVVSTIAVNLINIYSGGFSMLNVTNKLNPKVSMLILSVLATLLASVPIFAGDFLDTFSAFLEYLGAVFPPAIAIMIVDYFFLRKQQYQLDELSNEEGPYWYTNGFNWIAMGTWVAGALIFFTFGTLPIIQNTIGAVFLSFFSTMIIYSIVGKLFIKIEH